MNDARHQTRHKQLVKNKKEQKRTIYERGIKMSIKKRILSSVLAFTCILGCIPHIAVSAAESKSVEYNRLETDSQSIQGNVKKYGQLFAFEDDSELSYVKLKDNAQSMEMVDAIQNMPQLIIEGSKCLEVRRRMASSKESMKIEISLGGERDFSDTPVICYNVNSYGGQVGASLYYVKTTIISKNGTYEKLYGYLADSWNSIVIDMTDFEGKDAVIGIEIEFMSDTVSSDTWEGRFQIDNLFYGKLIDFRFAKDGDMQNVTVDGAVASVENDELILKASSKTVSCEVPEMTYTKVLSYLYSSSAAVKNAIYTVIDNKSMATEMKIYFRTASSPEYSADKCKTITISPKSKKLYIVNFSDNTMWGDDVIGFKYVFEGMNTGDVIGIDDIRLHEDDKIVNYAGEVYEINASSDKKSLSLKGVVQNSVYSAFSGGVIELYAHMPFATESAILKEEPIATVPVSELVKADNGYEFEFKNISLIKKGNKTYTDCKFTAVIKNNGSSLFIDEPRNIDNLYDIADHKYSVENPALTASVRDYGAKGDGFTDDTKAIQRAIDSVAQKGGGTVKLDGDGIYIATSIILKSNVTVYIAQGSVLRQSEDLRHYENEIELGHNSVALSYINWAHCNLASNYPLLYGSEVENVKITGGGKIVMSDVDNYGDDLMVNAQALEYQYSVCSHRLHVQPIGLSVCKNIEISSITINKASGYHILASHCENVAVIDVEMDKVKCVSSDGINVRGTNGAYIFGLLLNGNDDGIVLNSVYTDPRDLWWKSFPGENQAPRNIEVYSSYIQSGGGKAISLITWGTSDPVPTNEEIDGVTVMDCTLTGGHSVGTWADNPYNGKQPFDNTETNDYSAMKNFTIIDNEYLAALNLYPAKITNFVTDCGLIGADNFINGDCNDGLLYWTVEGENCVKTKNKNNYIQISGKAAAYEGIYLRSGEYLIEATVKTSGDAIFGVYDVENECFLNKKTLSAGEWDITSLFCAVENGGLYRIGIFSESGESCIDDLKIASSTMSASSNTGVRSEIDEDCSDFPEGFTPTGSTWEIRKDGNESYLTQTATGTFTSLNTDHSDYSDIKASVKVRIESTSGMDNMISFGLRANDGNSYCIYISPARNQIAIRKDYNGEKYLATAEFTPEIGKWYDIDMTLQSRGRGIELALYIDGEKMLSATDEGSLLESGCFRMSCYNVRASFDDILVSEVVSSGKQYTLNLADENGDMIDGARVKVYVNGVVAGEYASQGGKVSFSADEDAKVTVRVSAFGYERTGDIAVNAYTTDITMRKTSGVLMDEYDNADFITGAADGYKISNGKLVQTDGGRAGQICRFVASGFGDFSAQTNIRYTGGNSAAGDNISLYIYKGDEFIRVQYQPIYGLLSVHKLNSNDGLICYAMSENLDSLKAVGCEFTLDFGTKGDIFTLTAIHNGKVILSVSERIEVKNNSTHFELSTYGVTCESDHFYISSGDVNSVKLYDSVGNVLPDASLEITVDGKTYMNVKTDAFGVAEFSAVKGDIRASIEYAGKKISYIAIDNSRFTSVVIDDLAITGTHKYYTITFKDEKGNTIDKVSARDDESISFVPTASSDGLSYHFGWNDENDKLVDVFGLRGDAVVYANIKAKLHTIVFVYADGSKKTVSVPHGEKIVAPDAVNVEGHTFTGYDREVGAAYRDMAFYATYTLNDVNVKYVLPDGTLIESTTVKYGMNAKLPDVIAPSGTEFVGFDKSLMNITKDTTFTAVFKNKVYMVVFLDFEGNVVSVQNVERGNSAVAPTLKSDEYTFIGWNKSYENITGYTEISPLTEADITYELTFTDTVTGTSDVVSWKNDGSFKYEAKTYEGYDFDGWYYDPEFTKLCDLGTASFDGDTTLYGKYLKIANVKIECVGGSIIGLAEKMYVGYTYTFSVGVSEENGGDVKVTLGGNELTPNNGIYTFVAKDDMTLTIKASGNTVVSDYELTTNGGDDTGVNEEKKGCRGALNTPFILSTVIGACALFIKNKKENENEENI